MAYIRAITIAIAGVVAASLMGCGGGAAGPTDTAVGAVSVQIAWPERSGELQPALVPVITESIKVEVAREGRVVPGGTAIIERPNVQVIINNVAAGQARLRATAYPEPGAQGVAQAAGETEIAIVPGEMRGYGLVLTSTIDHIDVAPQPAEVYEGHILQLIAMAKNDSGEVVLVPTQGAFTWMVLAGDDHLAVDSSGIVTGLSAGEGIVNITENESGISRDIAVMVKPMSE